MLTFLSDCAGLFTGTFNAIWSVEIFRFLVALLVVQICFSIYFNFYRGMWKA